MDGISRLNVSPVRKFEHKKWNVVVVLWVFFALMMITSGSTLGTPLKQPLLDYSDLGGRLGLFGQFESLSIYKYNTSASLLTSARASNGDSNFYVKTKLGDFFTVGSVNGQIYQITELSENSVVISGNFTELNDKKTSSPIIYNFDDNKFSEIFPSSSNKQRDETNQKGISDGEVKTMFVDGDLVYLGGDFKYNNTYGLAIYNKTSETLSTPLFKGFGKNSSINAITKIFDEGDEENGSIIFGGSFNTLGLKELLTHTSHSNKTKKKNSTNSSLITAEQMISLKHATFTSVNEEGSDLSSLICPSKNDEWSVEPGSGGEWAAELPDEAKGVTPTKSRLYIPQGSNGVKLFRIYSYPNNGIMNLTYIDPVTNVLSYCDAWCPLMTLSNLTDATKQNKRDSEKIADSSKFVDEDGSFTTYYDPATKTKTLGYGNNYQEFAFNDQVAIDKIGVTVLDWYGEKGALAGFELYLNTIIVYGNNTLNDPNCDNDVEASSSESSGDFQSIRNLDSDITDTNYLVSTDSSAEITLYPNISYSGNYSIIMTTPGCIADGSCDYRSILNVSVIDNEDQVLTSKLIYQNNEYDKFDYLYYGHLKGAASNDGENKIHISYDSSLVDSNQKWIVVDKILANIVSLDKYYSNHTNHTDSSKNKSVVTNMKLNGLFEYSLSNFSSFDEHNVFKKVNNKTLISEKNSYVGNSTVNWLSSLLSKDSSVDELNVYKNSDKESLLILGRLNSSSKYLDLKDNNLMKVDVKEFNTTSNETVLSNIQKRDASSFQSFENVLINNTISKIFNYGNSSILTGEFQLKEENSSTVLSDLSKKNSSTSAINNFAIWSQNKWFGFGNDYIEEEFDSFCNLTVNGTEYFIFSSESTFLTWDNTNHVWLKDGDYTLDVTQAVGLNGSRQFFAGVSLNVMDIYSRDQALLNDEGDITSFNASIEEGNGFIRESFYVNESLSVVGGTFKSASTANIGFINDHSKNGGFELLKDKVKWESNTSVLALYADSSGKYLFIGTNGSLTIRDSTTVLGVVIYNMKDNAFLDTQPAALSLSKGDNSEVNAIVLHEESHELLVGGNFDSAGSLSCPGLCIYDLKNTRWNNPQQDQVLDGTVTDIKFYSSSDVLISGNLTYNGKSVNFATYNFEKSSFKTASTLNALGSEKIVSRFIMTDKNNGLGGRIIAYGKNFLSAFDGKKWHSIDDDIIFDLHSSYGDLLLLQLSESNKHSSEAYFDLDKILAVCGNFSIKGFGPSNVALFNGSHWQPYLFTADSGSGIGNVYSMLFKDSYGFQSSKDFKVGHLSKGKVVGISLACALGSTTFLGLLYLIPYFALFRKRHRDSDTDQRIQEKDMMNAVSPHDLLHEIDLQR
ncbi:uncharacterized protein PRCAT00001174001 [Priceomyces carsonii]|uniref:uncharacterized protein n=1 Tax=Priceomyces carsonii TaxID=28549 RepID=UPI002EDB016F|nr:unnamed protein product [Priceomyces carsonii]